MHVALGLAIVIGSQAPLTGKALDDALRRPIDLQVNRVSLDKVVHDLAGKHRFNVVIDTRVNRQFSVIGRQSQLPLELSLHQLAMVVGARAVLVGDIVYLVPQHIADRVGAVALTQAARLRSLPADLKNALLERNDARWTMEHSLGTLLRRLARHANLEVSTETDLDFPMLSDSVQQVQAVDLLTVLAAQVDLMAQIDPSAQQLRLVEMPEPPKVERTLQTPPAILAKAAEQLPRLVQGLETETADGKLKLRGTVMAVRHAELHLAMALAPKPKTPTETKYTLVFQNVTIDRCVERLIETTGRAVRVDQASFVKANRKTTEKLYCIAANLTLDRLLDVICTPARLTYAISPTEIVIRAEAP